MSSPPRPPLVPLVVLAALGAVVLTLRQHVFTIDSYYYLWDTEFADRSRLLHPHHLALQPLFRGWWRLWQWFEWPGRAVSPLQVLNLGLTLAGLAVAWRLLRRLAVAAAPAAAWCALLAVSYVTWSQATQADSLPLFALLASALLWWSARLALGPPPTSRTALAVGVTLAAGVLAHQVLVLWAIPLAWMVGRRARGAGRWRLTLSCLGPAGALVLAGYVVAAAVATGSLAPASLWRWFTGYSEEFAGRYGLLANLTSREVPRGLLSAFLTGGPLKPYLYGGEPLGPAVVLRGGPFLMVPALLLAGFWRLQGAWRTASPDHRQAWVNLAVLVAVSALFAAWWDPGQRKFWAPVVTGLVALAAAGWSSGPRAAGAVRTLPVAVIAAVVLGYNLAGGILPRHVQRDALQPLVMFVARHVGPEDAVILREDRVWQAAIYFEPDKPVHGIPGALSDRDDPEHRVLEAALADARRALTAGGVLYVADSEWPGIAARLRDDLGPLPAPEVVLPYGDLELGPPDQVLLALRLPRG
ncbi:MAG: hypothetical protein R3D98_17015 [Candidatus Krumholzibacteriia bacterium]